MSAQPVRVGGLQEFPEMKYSMGFLVDKIPIPDPSEFSGKESDLDTMGERDATGYLHRNMVATKYPVKLAYNNIPLETAWEICKLIRKEKFKFTWWSPYHCDFYEMDAYVGDRDFEAVWWPEGGIYIVNLSFSVIEY